jgi:hypothetical protein
MKKMLSILLCAVLLISALSGCVSVNIGGTGAIAGRGELEKFEVKVGEYSAIRVEGFAVVNYYSAPSDTVTLEIQPNLREHFRVEVINGELVAGMKRRMAFGSDFKVPVLTVSAPVLELLNISGAAMFTAHDTITSDSLQLRMSGAGTGTARLDVNSLDVNISGAGAFVLAGRADTARLSMSGAGAIEAVTLETRDAAVKLSGTGAIDITATETLDITASGAGSVQYKGGASVNINRSGLVAVTKLD